MAGTRPMLERIPVPTRIIVRRSEMSASALAEVVQAGEYAPSGGATCELEAGGEIIARGRIVKRWGRYCFKITEMAKEEKR
jgi:hypothetical protein